MQYARPAHTSFIHLLETLTYIYISLGEWFFINGQKLLEHTSKGRLKCLNCGLEAHRDSVGVINMVTLHGGMPIGLVAQPCF